MGFIASYQSQLELLCKKYSVSSLYAFGSVNTPAFNVSSDIDLVVDISSKDPFEYSDNYFDLKSELEKLFKRPVDLLEDKSIRNPYLRKNIDQSKVLVYGR